MDAIATLFSGPLLIPSVCLLIALAVSVIAVVTSLDFDQGSVDASGYDGGSFEWLFVISRWLNLNQVPEAIWFCLFALIWWCVSLAAWLGLDRLYVSEPGLIWSSLLTIRNLAVALPLTKFCTNPLRSLVADDEISSNTLIGKECIISSGQAGPDFGQAKVRTDAAPLLLNVRTDGRYLAKGARVWITYYDERRRTYLVSPVDPPPALADEAVATVREEP